MENIKDSIKLFRFCKKTVLLYEVVIHIITFSVLMPLYVFLTNLAVQLSGIGYLNKTNISRFFVAPTTYLLFLFFLVVIAFFVLLNTSGLVLAYDEANHLKKIGVVRLLFRAIRQTLRMFHPHNLGIIPYLFFQIPIVAAELISLSFLNLRLPVYLSLYIKNKSVLFFVITGVYLVAALWFSRTLFAVYKFIVKGIPFQSALKESVELVQGRKKVIPEILLWTAVIVAIAVAVHLLVIGVMEKAIVSMIHFPTVKFLAATMTESANVMFYLLYSLLCLPLVVAFMSNSYYNLKPNEEGIPNIDEYEETDKRERRKKQGHVLAVILSAAILLDILFYALKANDFITIKADYLNKVTVTAHRGSSGKAPENTLAAFRLAMDEGADVIEFDVRQTKDGEIVVSHDENLKRITGEKKKIGELTLEELKAYNVGERYGAEYAEERIPTLRETLDLCAGETKLNIELKTAATDQDLIEKVVSLYQEYDLYEDAVVASQDYYALVRVKELDEKIPTVYVMSVALGSFYNLKHVDGFSIKYSFITAAAVENAHKSGKDIYAWTINDKRLLEDMMNLNVDSIITDTPYLMKEDMYEIYEQGSLYDLIRQFLNSLF